MNLKIVSHAHKISSCVTILLNLLTKTTKKSKTNYMPSNELHCSMDSPYTMNHARSKHLKIKKKKNRERKFYKVALLDGASCLAFISFSLHNIFRIACASCIDNKSDRWECKIEWQMTTINLAYHKKETKLVEKIQKEWIYTIRSC